MNKWLLKSFYKQVCTCFLRCYYLSTEITELEVNSITVLNHICLHVEEGKMHQARLISPLLCHLDLLSITQITHFQLFPLGLGTQIEYVQTR